MIHWKVYSNIAALKNHEFPGSPDILLFFSQNKFKSSEASANWNFNTNILRLLGGEKHPNFTVQFYRNISMRNLLRIKSPGEVFFFPFLYSEDKRRFLKLEDSLTHTNFFVYWHDEISIFRDLVLKSLNNNQILICCLPRSALFCNGDNISFPCYFKSGNRKLFPLPNFFPLLRLCTLLVLFHEAISPSLISLLST